MTDTNCQRTLNFPLRLKGLGRYIVDSTNKVVGRYYKGETSVILDALNESKKANPDIEGISIQTKASDKEGELVMYSIGKEVLVINFCNKNKK